MKKKYILIFNKLSGVYAGKFHYSKDTESKIDKNLISYKVVEMTDNEYWSGNFNTGKITVKDPDTIIVSEADQNTLAGKKIEAKYPLYKQMNILIDMISLMSENIPQTDPRYVVFMQMKDYIDRTRENNQRYIESAKMAEDRVFISLQDIKEAQSLVLEGPLRSIVGRV